MRQWDLRIPGIRFLILAGCGALLGTSLLVSGSAVGIRNPAPLRATVRPQAQALPMATAPSSPSPVDLFNYLPDAPSVTAVSVNLIYHAPAPQIVTHWVRPGENLALIASRYGTTTESILLSNPDVDPELLLPDTVLTVLTTPGVLHTVAPGEYVEEIAYMYGVDATTVFGANPIVASGYLMPDERLIIPGASAQTRRQTLASRGGRSRQAPVDWIWPVRGSLTSRFGPRWGAFHGGIDIAAVTGTPIVAAAGGTVDYVGSDWLYGLHVLIDHGSGLRTRYAHASAIRVKAGDWVDQGQTVALVGSTGYSTGPHLHFEILADGQHVDPLQRLP